MPQIVAAGINDWGGVSPLTPDHVNPEAPWPHLQRLADETAVAGKFLEQRLTIYPRYALDAPRWLDPAVKPAVWQQMDAGGFARRDSWVPGEEAPVPAIEADLLRAAEKVGPRADDLEQIIERCESGSELSEADVTRLFEVRGEDFSRVIAAADRLRPARHWRAGHLRGQS